MRLGQEVVIRARPPLRIITAAKLLGFSRPTLYKLIREGGCRCVLGAAGEQRLPLAELRRLARQLGVELEISTR